MIPSMKKKEAEPAHENEEEIYDKGCVGSPLKDSSSLFISVIFGQFEEFVLFV